MKPYYQESIERLMNNFLILEKPFMWEHNLLIHLVALSYTMSKKNVDVDQIKGMKKYIKTRSGAFSPYRGMMNFTVAGLLCAQYDNPEDIFDQMYRRQPLLKEAGFKQSSYLCTVSYALEKTLTTNDQAVQRIDKAMDIYKDMKANHPFLTSGDDYALAILLSTSDHDVDALESYYRALSEVGFTKSNGLQTLSHILAFSTINMRDMVDRCSYLFQVMKENKLKVTTEYYPAIGLVALLDMDEKVLGDDFVEVATWLKSLKKYKWLGKGMNILLASGIISDYYIQSAKENGLITTTLSVSIETIIAAQTAAMIASITAATAAASSASS
jgi:hypothetical protein